MAGAVIRCRMPAREMADSLAARPAVKIEVHRHLARKDDSEIGDRHAQPRREHDPDPLAGNILPNPFTEDDGDSEQLAASE